MKFSKKKYCLFKWFELLVYSENVLTEFAKGLQLVVNGDQLVLKKYIVQVIVELQKIVTSKSYNVNGTMLPMLIKKKLISWMPFRKYDIFEQHFPIQMRKLCTKDFTELLKATKL